VGVRSIGLFLLSVAAVGQSLPDGPGKGLVEAVCTACHTLERVAAKRATKAEWADKVLEMLQEDPDITQKERDQIVEYLAKNFPPKKEVGRKMNRLTRQAIDSTLVRGSWRCYS
jgi:cytochrome c1